jgi:hypothetical protein
MIRFCYTPGASRNAGRYLRVVELHSKPVAVHLTAGTFEFGNDPGPDRVNVVFHKLTSRHPTFFHSHGIADKGWRPSAKLAGHRWVAVSGPWWRDRYIADGMDAAKIRVCGYARLDPIVEARRARPANARPVIVWAPTHGNIADISSWPQCQTLAQRLEQQGDWDVIVSPHPQNARGHMPTSEALVKADVVIADAGSTMYEAWALDIPVVFPTFMTGRGVLKRRGGRTMEARVYRERIGYHADSRLQLSRAIARALEVGIDQAAVDLAERVLPRELRGCSGQVTAGHLLDAVGLGVT